ncbi:acylneuraminate cytidylyltransferase [bacterium]|nr:acylneuraminate cytidylyltransferase [bacterium]
MFTVILQARTSSSRLPGKVLMPIGKSYTMLSHIIKRLSFSRYIDSLLIATSTDKSDDLIVDEANRLSIECYRGDLENVFSRYYAIANKLQTTWIIRLNGDCPYIDPKIVDFCCLYAHLYANYDYISTITSKWPIGQHVELIKRSTFLSINQSDLTSPELEHVTPYIYNNPSLFRLLTVDSPFDYSYYRMTVDYLEDYELANEFFLRQNFLATYLEVIEYFKRNEKAMELCKKYRKPATYTSKS